MSKFPYFKRLNNILSGIYNIFCVSIQPFGLLPHISHYDSAAIKMGIQISLWDPALNSFEHIPRNGIVGSCGNSILIFSTCSFLRLIYYSTFPLLLLLLLNHCSHVWLCATPSTAAHQAPPSLGFSRQEHWSGLPFPSPMCESEKWKWNRSFVSDS